MSSTPNARAAASTTAKTGATTGVKVSLRSGRLLAAVTRWPRWRGKRSIRFRLTLTYGVLFLAGGLVLITITYLLMRHTTGPVVFVSNNPTIDGPTSIDLSQMTPAQRALTDGLRANAEQQRQADLDQLVIQASIALVITTIVALAAGWFVAGRALRPLRSITTTARQISQHNLDERLNLDGPHDEVKDLADTMDDLLARIETAFDAQRRFVAHASHELRTPLTWDRALIEVTLSDPDADIDTYRSTHLKLLASTEEKERLIEALLTLATSERGVHHHQRIDLAELTQEAVHRHHAAARNGRLSLHTQLTPVAVGGNRDLVRRLVDNLLDNAISHNLTQGSIDVRLEKTDGNATLVVSNTGQCLTAGDIKRIQEPFQRLEPTSGSHHHGHGLGLSIVNAVAVAHAGTLTLEPREGGGLTTSVTLPLLPNEASGPITRRGA